MRLDLTQTMILIVDDNKFIRRLVREILASFKVGYIIEAENGLDAIDKLKVACPDIIICDWMMDRMTGIEFLHELRAGNTRVDRQTPVLMLTGQLDATHVLQARELGVNGYLAKPVTVKGLMTRLIDVIRATAPADYA